MSGLRGYDAWLERPYQERCGQEPPGWVEDLLDTEFFYEGERAIVEYWEDWSDADEDGPYGGTDLVVRVGDWTKGQFGLLSGGRAVVFSPADLEDVLNKQEEHKPEEENAGPK